MGHASEDKQKDINKDAKRKKSFPQLEYGDQVGQIPNYGNNDKSQGQLVSMKDAKNKAFGPEANPNQDTDAALNVPAKEQG